VTLDNNTPGSAVQAKMATWQNLDIEFAETGADVVLTFRITNKMTDDILSVNISSNYASNVNSNAKIEVSEQVSVLNTTDEKTKDYTVTFKIGNTELDAALEDFDINIELIKGEATVAEVQEVSVAGTKTDFAATEYKASTTELSFLPNESITIPAGSAVASGKTEIDVVISAKTPNFAKTNIAYDLSEINDTKVYVRSASLFLDSSKETQTLKIYICNNNTEAKTISLADLGMTLSFDNSNNYDELVQHDAEENYYYVEMGTIPNSTNTGSEYIRWRYISEDGQTKDATPFTTKGYYVLETMVHNNTTIRADGNSLGYCNYNNEYVYQQVDGKYQGTHLTTGWENIKANDYATSTIRQYMNNTTEVVSTCAKSTNANNITTYTPDTTKYQSNMYIDYCIDPDNDVVYSLIQGRKISDLYKNNNSNGTDVEAPTFTSNELDMDAEDKFWLLSAQELATIVSSDENLLEGWHAEDIIWDSGNFTGQYWLRSPNADDSHGAHGVNSVGYCDSHGALNGCAARAAFTLA
ncbi:MAG: hypothetical protein IJA69_00265, partial [Clostridia bacterium]|nr:hypothetical protein [Clostridia bacterium]